MKNIDFLPTRYREGYAARAAVIKRWTIVLGIAIIITPLAIYQYLIHAAVVHRFVVVEPEYMQAQAKSQYVARLEQELAAARGEAALLAWLSHPWPRSQVLAQLHAPLPESLRLTGIRLAAEPKSTSTTTGPQVGRSRAARRAAEEEATQADAGRPPHEKDLQRLLELATQNDTVVTLNGVTVSTTDLHKYVALLRTSGMFDKSELRSVESQPGQESSKQQTFEIRLVLASGHAQPRQKESKAAAIEPVAAWTQAVERIARGP